MIDQNGERYLPIKTAAAFFIVTLLASALIGWGVAQQIARAKSEDVVEAQIEVCERIKHDRVDNARGWTQAEETWSARAQNHQLSLRERKVAQETAVIYGETANQLRTRILDCEPLVKHNKYVIDERLLREAQGTL